MTDKEIYELVMAQVLPAIQDVPELSTVKMARNYQSRQHGANQSPYVYFFKVGDHRYGWVKRKDIYSEIDGDFTHSEVQQYESIYQFSAWIPQAPADTSGLTESDVLNIVSGIIQSDEIIEAFRAGGVGIQRVSDVRNPYIVDDRDRFEAVPSFDVVLSYFREAATTIPAVVTYEANVRRV